MNRSTIAIALRLALLLAFGLLADWRQAAAQDDCTSAQCHAALLKGKNAHAATDPCTNCHEPTASPHPRPGARTFRLTAEPPALCATCHEAIGSKSVVHPPAKEGLCTTCHDPHASTEAKLLVAPLKELCETCHADLASLKEQHGPFSSGECIACHAPHESAVEKLLVKPGEELCATCHLGVPDWMKRREVHAALEGGCTSCHDPHGAAHPKLLAEEGPKLCFQCHDSIATKVEKGAVVHAPARDGAACVQCHSPHASDTRKLLLKPEKETCLGCHTTVVTAGMTLLHGPIEKGMCTACHDPHGSPYPRLLSKEFPAAMYVPYSDTEYALCFSCHNRDLVQYPDTSYATGFRDGERNLHYLHVHNAQKGRTCTLCHEVHGSAGPKLVAASVRFGKWNLPLKFVKTETGGGCTPGCHKPAVYDRESPGRKPAPSKTPAAGG
jgi:predicted CXXCH cytochrome family protein